ncbi:hypothetical protein IQ260_12135 [Leptolyngbya cf. ectocarpi LEGE 11479]|uniref:Uncharacterized protein n=1 Tax=Leptolyngbya cf. ectocarpi LEGE 11479 TaxID=1828722 RepID=A0A928ZTZ2_LEPEC|nr:hypothetical protein [Leptolyngbya ectocarpi]MBE9067405.1 hypothetical protein [Leptolyngbya cf. ectocarpi LEGE 11479]
MGHKSAEEDPKVRATGTIWGCAIGMLGVCIPIVAITESGILLPFLVVLGAAGGTASVWLTSDKHRREDVQLAQTVKSLEERLINLETIYVSLPDVDKPLPLPETTDNH